MPYRIRALDEAARRSRRDTVELGAELMLARRTSGATQAEVARALGWSASKVRRIERGQRTSVTHLELAMFGSLVGLHYSGRFFVGTTRLRDASQMGMINAYRSAVGGWGWACRIEEPIALTGDLRAFDLMLRTPGRAVAHEFITRLHDAQAQFRPILRKQRDAGVGCLVLVLKDTAQNRRALGEVGPALNDLFPLGPRAVLDALRSGREPSANGIVFWRSRLSGAA